MLHSLMGNSATGEGLSLGLGQQQIEHGRGELVHRDTSDLGVATARYSARYLHDMLVGDDPDLSLLIVRTQLHGFGEASGLFAARGGRGCTFLLAGSHGATMPWNGKMGS